MFKILRQLQEELKQISLLLCTPTDEWIKGHVSYVDEECVSFETEEREGVYYTLVIKLDAIIAIEFVSDIRVPNKERYTPPEEENNGLPFFEEGEDEINN